MEEKRKEGLSLDVLIVFFHYCMSLSCPQIIFIYPVTQYHEEIYPDMTHSTMCCAKQLDQQ